MAFMKRLMGRKNADTDPVSAADESAPTNAPLRARLKRTSGGFSQALKAAFGARTDEEIWQGVEDALLMADVGLAATTSIVAAARKRAGRTASEQQVRDALKLEILSILNQHADRDVHGADDAVSVVLVVGVNGTGKTTTTGKLAKRWVDEG